MRRTAAFIAVQIAVVLAVYLSGCAPAGTDNPAMTDTSDKGSPGKDAAAPTLTKSTLPTEVGTKWTVTRYDEDGTPFELNIKGPWNVEPGPDWRTESYEIVATGDVPGIDKFSDYTYVLKDTSEDFGTYYYPRLVTDEWVFGLGRIHPDGDEVKVETNAPAKFWPLQLKVGQSYKIYESAERNTEATVLARNTAQTPAGTIENAYLVRFRTEDGSDGEKTDDSYYLFAPNVGMVAYFSHLTGSEQTGFTTAGSIVVLSSLPRK
ncbi:MAG: hypothetical protein ACYC77_05000 [Coriobacteriia bacterium]